MIDPSRDPIAPSVEGDRSNREPKWTTSQITYLKLNLQNGGKVDQSNLHRDCVRIQLRC